MNKYSQSFGQLAKKGLFFAMLFFSRSIFVLNGQSISPAVVDSLNTLCWELHEDSESREEALALAKRALQYANQIDYTKGCADAFSRLGQIISLDLKFREARLHYDSCLILRRCLADSVGVASVYTNYCRMSRLEGDFAQALESGFYAEKILNQEINKGAENASKVKGILYYLEIELANAYSGIYDHKESLFHALKAYRIVQAQQDTAQFQLVMHSLGNIYYYLIGDTLSYSDTKIPIDSSLYFYHLSVQFTEDSSKMADAYGSICELFVDLEMIDSAKLYLGMAEKIRLAQADSIGLYYIWTSHGNINMGEKKFDKALYYYKKAETVLHLVPDDVRVDLYPRMAAVCDSLGDPKNTIKYLNLFKNFNVKLYTEKQDRFQMVERSAASLKQKLIETDLVVEKRHNQIIALLAGILSLILLVVYLVNRQLKRKAIEQTLTIKSLIHSSDQKYIEGAEKQLEKIAAELHADIGTSAISLDMVAASLCLNLEKNSSEYQEALALRAQLAHVFGELRTTAHGFGKMVLEKSGLIAAIEDLIQKVLLQKGVVITFNAEGIKESISRENAQILYRIIQNLLSNSLRHGKPSNIAIDMKVVDNDMFFAYSDDGTGFDMDDVKSGAGLADIHKMASALEAEGWHLETSPGNGFSLKFSLPIK